MDWRPDGALFTGRSANAGISRGRTGRHPLPEPGWTGGRPSPPADRRAAALPWPSAPFQNFPALPWTAGPFENSGQEKARPRDREPGQVSAASKAVEPV